MPRPKFHAHEARKKYGWASTRDYRPQRPRLTRGVSTRSLLAALLFSVGLCVRLPAFSAECSAQSAEHTTALVEVYSARVCAGCAHADAWLSRLARTRPVASLIAISLRVDDRAEAQGREVHQRLAARQRRLLPLQRTALVYSPQVLLQGREFPDWNRPGAFDSALQGIYDRRARAHIAMVIRAVEPGRLHVVVRGRVLDPSHIADSVLYLAPFASRLDERAVRDWLGPVAAAPDGHISVSRVLDPPPGATARASGVVAFVEDRRSREVLQALLLAACSP
jgi:hypothetical protein